MCDDTKYEFMPPVAPTPDEEGRLFSMAETCGRTGLPYETLKFYCNKGLVPGVRRDGRNRRVFDEATVRWVESLQCLKHCGMSISEMRDYVDLCAAGEASLRERKAILAEKQHHLREELAAIQGAIDFIDQKQAYYDDVLAGRTPYYSNLRTRVGEHPKG